VLAALDDVAGVVGTKIAVVAVEWCARSTRPLEAQVAYRARVAVAARKPLVERNQRAGARVGVAFSLLADCVQPGGSRTFHDGLRVDRTLKRRFAIVAIQRTVAQVAVFQRKAVGIDLALARYLGARALAGLARVSHRTRVRIVARILVGCEGTPSGPVTLVVGAGVVVIAKDGSPHAHPFCAMVCGRARVPIHALGAVEQLVLASLGGLTGVLRALVAVVARPLIGVAVAVVVYVVALLGRRGLRIAVRKAQACADPLALAHAQLVLDQARRPEL